MIDKRTIISFGVIFVVIIGVCFLFAKMFSGKGSANDELVKQLVAAKDTIINKEHQKIDIYERLIEEKDRSLDILHEKDSAADAHSKQIELNYTKLNETLRNIPIRINRISGNKDSIRANFREF